MALLKASPRGAAEITPCCGRELTGYADTARGAEVGTTVVMGIVLKAANAQPVICDHNSFGEHAPRI